MRRLVWAAFAVIIVAGIAVAVWVWRDDIGEAARQAVIGDQLRQDLRECNADLKRSAERREQISAVAEERLEQLEALREERNGLQEVIDDDESAADWAGRDLPDGAVELFRDKAGNGHEDGDGESTGRVDDMPDGGAGDDKD